MAPSMDSARPIMAPSVSPSSCSPTYSLFPTPAPTPAPFALNPTPPLGPPLNAPPPRQDTASARASKRLSTLSTAASQSSHATDATATTVAGGDPRFQDLSTWQKGLERLERPRLQQQRYVPSREKSESIASLALGAKVERALGRRMTGQDAVMRVQARPMAVAAGGEKSG